MRTLKDTTHQTAVSIKFLHRQSRTRRIDVVVVVPAVSSAMNKCLETVETRLRLQAAELLTNAGGAGKTCNESPATTSGSMHKSKAIQVPSSAFVRSCALDSLLLGEMILKTDLIFGNNAFGLLNHEGELRSLMCTDLSIDAARCLMESDSGVVEALCSCHNRKRKSPATSPCSSCLNSPDGDCWKIHGAKTLFLYNLCYALSSHISTSTSEERSTYDGVSEMIRRGFLAYLLARLEAFQSLADEGIASKEDRRFCRWRKVEIGCCLRSTLLLIPKVNDMIWDACGTRLLFLSVKLAETATNNDNSTMDDYSAWCHLLQAILTRGPGGPTTDNNMEQAFDSALLDAIGDLCIQWMDKTCCISCKYKSEYYQLFHLVLQCRENNITTAAVA